MPIYAFCSNTRCSQVLKLHDNLSSRQAISVSHSCQSCGSRLVSRCWNCLNSIVRPPRADEEYRCEFCRVDLRAGSIASRVSA